MFSMCSFSLASIRYSPFQIQSIQKRCRWVQHTACKQKKKRRRKLGRQDREGVVTLELAQKWDKHGEVILQNHFLPQQKLPCTSTCAVYSKSPDVFICPPYSYWCHHSRPRRFGMHMESRPLSSRFNTPNRITNRQQLTVWISMIKKSSKNSLSTMLFVIYSEKPFQYGHLLCFYNNCPLCPLSKN